MLVKGRLLSTAPSASSSFGLQGTQEANGMPSPRAGVGLDGNLYARIGYSDVAVEASDFCKVALKNIGNTCFLNALLHSLARLPSVRHWTIQHLNICSTTHTNGGMCALCDLALDLNDITMDIQDVLVTPRTATKRSVWGGEAYDNFAQHDASEAFTALLSSCDEVDFRAACVKAPDLWLADDVRSARYSTPYYRTFGGLMLSTLSCNRCHYFSQKSEIFHCLSLAVPAATSSIELALARHWNVQDLVDKSDHCTECGQSQCQQKKDQLARWPRTLVLHLKRWTVISQFPFVQEKNSTPVSFEVLLPVPEKAAPYTLRAVIVHHGQAGGGHYTAFVRSADHQWYHCDDNLEPKAVSTAKVLAAEAYMLFYEEWWARWITALLLMFPINRPRTSRSCCGSISVRDSLGILPRRRSVHHC